MKIRKGFTLVELLVAMTMGSTLLVLSIGLVHQTMMLSKTIRKTCERGHATNRFVEQFRADIHSSKQVTCTEPGLLTLDWSNGLADVTNKVVYRRSNQRVSREESANDGLIRREDLVLGERSFATFQLSEEGTIACFEIQTETRQLDTSVRLDRRIEAMVGRTAMQP